MSQSFPQEEISYRRGTPDDDHHGRCSWAYLGERCHYPGAVSHGTLGRGPWYCIDHLTCQEPGPGAEIVRQSRDFSAGHDPRNEIRRARDEQAALEAEELAQEEPGSGG